MTFPICANLKNRNGLNKKTELVWTHISRLEMALVLSGGCPQGTSGVHVRTELDFGQAPTSLFPGGFLEVTWGKDKVSALLCKAPPSNGLTESPWLSPRIREWAWTDGGWEAVYLRLHGQVAYLPVSKSVSTKAAGTVSWEFTENKRPLPLLSAKKWVGSLHDEQCPGAPFHSLANWSLPPGM